MQKLCLYQFIICLIFIAVSNSNASNYYKINKYTELDGLASANINTVFQDSRGYIWIGTIKGLSKYNGFEFENYNTDVGLNNNFIKSIYEDSKGYLWIASNEGLNRINLTTTHNLHFENIYEGAIVTDIVECEDNILFTSNLGLHIFNYNEDSIRFIDKPRLRFIENINDNFYVGSVDGIFQLNTDNYDITKLKIEIEINGKSICEFENDILIGSNSGVFNLTTGNVMSQFQSDFLDLGVNDLQSDSNQLWISTESGFYFYNSLENRIVNLIQDDCNHSMQDNAGNIWISSDNGLYKYLEYPFEIIDQEEGEILNGISAIENINGEIYVGENSGSLWTIGENQNYNKVSIPSILENGKPIQSIHQDVNRNIWISNLLGGVYFTEGKEWIKKTDPNGVLNLFVFDIESNNEEIWFGGARGLVKIQNEAYTYYTINETKDIPFVNDIVLGKDNKIYLALNSGFAVIEKNGIELFETFKETSCNAIFIDNMNRFYLATANKGIYTFDVENGLVSNVKNYRSSKGLSNDNVNSIMVSKDGTIWAGTDFGINRISKNGIVKVFKIKDNLERSRALPRSVSFAYDRILFGTYDGIISVPTNISNGQKSDFPVHITGIDLLGDDLDSGNIVYENIEFGLPRELRLPYNANIISFKYEGLSFTDNSKLEYRIKLKNRDREFKNTSSERAFTYTNLEPGYYTFSVNAFNSDLNIESNTASFSFEIKKPYWQKWWFRILLFLLVVGLIYFYVSNRIQIIKRNAKEMSEFNRKISEFRLTALRAQMNPHFIFNALYSIQHFITTNEKESAINYLAKFASLIRLILENSDKNEITLEKEDEMLSLYLDLERLRFDNKFEYAIEIDPEIDKEEIKIPYLLIQPFVENAVIHGIRHKEGNGKIIVAFKLIDNKTLFCYVEDDGIGREKSSEIEKPSPIKSKSLGLKLNEERLSVLNPGKLDESSVKIVDLKNADQEAIGTRVEITIHLE